MEAERLFHLLLFYVSTADVVFAALRFFFSAAFCSNSIAQQLYVHRNEDVLGGFRLFFHMIAKQVVFIFMELCRVCILQSDSAAVVIATGETLQIVCFGISMIFSDICFVMCFAVFFSFVHKTFRAPLWKAMDACQVVCLHCPPFVRLFLLLFSLPFSFVYFSVLSPFQSHHWRKFLPFLVA